MAHPKYVYLNDRVVPWDEGRVHVASVGFKFGIGVFEGLRAYWNADREQMFVLQLAEHMHRLEYSQKFMRFDEILPGREVGERILELLRANGFRENVHIMSTVFVEGFGPPHTTGPVGLSILAAPRKDIPWTETGCTAHVSSWQRVAGHRDADAGEVQRETTRTDVSPRCRPEPTDTTPPSCSTAGARSPRAPECACS